MTKLFAQKAQDNIDPETGRMSITVVFGEKLAVILADKISAVHATFDAKGCIRSITKGVVGKRYTQRIDVFADALRRYLPDTYTEALAILMKILGLKNTDKAGMFTNFYWLIPVGKFVGKYGLDNFAESIKAIEEITKRNTGEYAIRPFTRKYPAKTLAVCALWAKSRNVHLRRLASEGLRKASMGIKLDTRKDDPEPIFISSNS